jgi:hypothetical protein
MINPSETKGRSFVLNSNEEGLSKAKFDSLYYLPDSLHSKDDWPISDHYFTLIDDMNKADELTPKQILDSLRLDNLPFVRRIATRQLVKINHETSASLLTYVLRQIPIIMFFILPLYAFVLKLFYWKKGLYIKHLIHSLHIHSFFFFALTIAWIVRLIFGEALENTPGTVAIFISAIYIAISLKKVYLVTWGWTIVRFFMIGIIYSLVLTFTMGIGFVISLAFF